MNIRMLFLMVLFATMTAFASESGKKKVIVNSKDHGWLGVSIRDVTPQFARDQELKIKEGAYISEISKKSPADKSGLKIGDVVVEFNGKKIETAEDLTDAVRATAPGTKVTAKINRSGESKTVTVEIGKNKMRRFSAAGFPRAPRVIINMFGSDVEGMELMELNKQLAEYFDVPDGKGVLVKEVEKDENASKAGIRAGDIIIKIGDETIKDVEDVHDAVSDIEDGKTVPVEMLRKGKKMTVTLEVSENDDDRNHFYWRGHSPEGFNFEVVPELDRLHKELDIRMKDLPRKKIDIKKFESGTIGAET